jgi:outer membrane protein assembly factor BamA
VRLCCPKIASFEERRNQSQIGRTEDLFTGMFLRTFLGLASTEFGSDRDSLLLGLQAGDSFENLDASKTLLISTQGATRFERGDLHNASLQTDARFYWRAAERQLFFGALTGVITKNLDAEQQLVLGGDQSGLRNTVLQGPGLRVPLVQPDTVSLRGYPLRYQDGSSMALLTLEHRYYTPYYLFRILYVGGAAFMDVGRTWGRGTTGAGSAGLLKDAGIGLRFGNSRSAFGSVIHVDLAFPLGGPTGIDKVQFIVETKASF